MAKKIELDTRLQSWAQVYGGGKYNLRENLPSSLASAIKWGGPPPTGLGQSLNTHDEDEVQNAVVTLQRQPGGLRPAMVLRLEYFRPDAPFEVKRQLLKKIGQGMGRSDYYKSLKLAKAFVAGWLRIDAPA